jgi:hypothetical protein
MYSIHLHADDGSDRLLAEVEADYRRLADLRPLAERIGEIMKRDVYVSRLLGIDPNTGQDLAPLNRGEPLTPAMIARRGGDGPPLAPRRNESRVFELFEVDVDTTPSRAIVTGGWPGIPWLAFHLPGPEHSGRLPVRDIVGVREESDRRVLDESRAYFAGETTGTGG